MSQDGGQIRTVVAPSSRAIFSDLDAFYAARIAPLLKDAETRRRRAFTRAAAFALAGAIGALVIAFRGGDASVFLAVLSFAMGVGAGGAQLNGARGEISERLLATIAAHFGFRYRRNPDRPAFVDPFFRFGLAPAFNDERWEDELAGTYEDVAFTLVEGQLRHKSTGRNKRTRTVFHGQFLVIEAPDRFTATTIIKRDAGPLNAAGAPGDGFRRVGLAAPGFEKAFEAWSTDQVAARTLLDPIMLERFEALDRLFNGAKLRAAFHDGRIYVALETGDKLDAGSMLRPLDGPSRFETVIKEFDLIFDLIDLTLRPVKGTLTEALSLRDVRSG